MVFILRIKSKTYFYGINIYPSTLQETKMGFNFYKNDIFDRESFYNQIISSHQRII